MSFLCSEVSAKKIYDCGKILEETDFIGLVSCIELRIKNLKAMHQPDHVTKFL